MHKVVIAPDSFKGVLSAREVCDIISYKINRHYPFAKLSKCLSRTEEREVSRLFSAQKTEKRFFATSRAQTAKP